jgi:hypothetical protein
MSAKRHHGRAKSKKKAPPTARASARPQADRDLLSIFFGPRGNESPRTSGLFERMIERKMIARLASPLSR